MKAKLDRVAGIAAQEKAGSKRIVVLMSLGQLNKYDWKRTVGAFSTILATQSVFSTIVAQPFYWLYVAARYLIDEKLFGGKIAAYKKGDMDTKQFVTWMKSMAGFGALSDEQVQDSWNAMSEIDLKTADALSALLRDNPNLDLAIFSATNPLHFDNVLNKCQAYIKNQEANGGFEECDLAISFKARTLDTRILASSAFDSVMRNIDTEAEVRVLSLVTNIINTRADLTLDDKYVNRNISVEGVCGHCHSH